MSSLDPLRRRIDQLDVRLLDLLNQRGRLVKEIGAVKQKDGRSVFAPERERDLLEHLKQINHGPLPAEAVESVFREVVHACRHLQKQLRVAYFGPEATYTHQATLRAFGRGARLAPVRTIPEVFTEVEKGRADYGVVPIENSTEGVVNHTLDMFMESNLSICAELELPIWHALLAHKGVRGVKGVKTLFAHYQALAQCRRWIESHVPDAKIVDATSTAESARLAARTPRAASIASRLAADHYGLQVLSERIEDQSKNYTRFLVIGTAQPQQTGRDKTSIMFSIKDRVGALFDILVPFKRWKINLTKIESRPTRQRAWEYVFFVDFLGHRSEARVQKALQQLEGSCIFLKILGSYPKTE
jgi:chorismate mutase / prephenate dehydratase